MVVCPEDIREMALADYLRMQREDTPLPGRLDLTLALVQKARDWWERLSPEQRARLRLGVAIPAGLLGFPLGAGLPDLDIAVLGIGAHRYFLTHSALGAFFVRQFLRRMTGGGIGRAVVGGAGAGMALGLGGHLVIDGSFGLLDGQKSVQFGIPGLTDMGSLLSGTLVDDNLYLLANGLWALIMARDMVVLATGKQPEEAQQTASRYFPEPVLSSLRARLRAI
ncbi:hypothetical protein Rmar_2908 (plasmid) [Rhodothermus marinus DSM 4252]|uniref:Uncharacterized protein n=2 Tax=Rhodothermus marinus TaxID=29549 RepID=D0MKV2_RHOM4|nr:hypothetical protein Rmar_2908 [Rhodothermus marinus DSM 4252]